MRILNKLKDLDLVSGDKTLQFFEEHYSDIFDLPYNSESELMRILWARYKSANNRNLSGQVFEGLLAIIFYRSGIKPFYVQAKFTFVSNVSFDFVAFSQEYGPIAISAKTSLRERYKQADLEGTAFKQVHRGAKSYLITLDERPAQIANGKIEKDLILGLDKVIVATSSDFDNFISELKSLHYEIPDKVEILKSSYLVE